MRRFLYAVCLFSASIPLKTYAQLGEADALRYSQDILGGTARFSAMGGAFCAVGGDLSTLSYNPAGIAVFTKNQLEISPGLTLQSTNSNNGGNSQTSQASSFNLQSLGLVATRKVRKGKDDVGGWKSYNFGFAYNRLNNFNDNVTIQGYSHSSTYLDYLTAQAQGTNVNNLEPFYLAPAFGAGLLDTMSNSNASQYFNIIHPSLASGSGDYIEQQENISTTGSMGESDFTFGGNYNDRLFIGATFGIVDVNYNLTDTYTEIAEYSDPNYGFSNYSLVQNLNTTGVGYNVKLGFIYRIMDWLRIGGSVISPTFFNLTDNFSTAWQAAYSGAAPNYSGPGGPVNTYPDGSALGAQTSYGYNLTTPLKAVGGAAVVINNQAIVSADYEYVDYSTINVNSNDVNLPAGYTSQLNTAIGQDFIQANNLRFGAEWVLYPISLRAGYAIYGNPYNQSTVGYTSIRNTYSAGVGIKINNVALDFAYTLMQYNEQYQFYPGQTPTTLKTNVSNVIFTLAYNFDNPKNRAAHRRRFGGYPPPPPPPPPGAY